MEDDARFQPNDRTYAPPSSSPKSTKGIMRFVFIIIAILVLVGIGFGITKFMGSQNKTEEKTTPTPTEYVFPSDTPSPTPQTSPSPTPGPTKAASPTPKPTQNPVDKTTGLDRSKLSVEVLNGSGTAGVAKKAADILKNLGYNVTSTGNADNFDYANTTIEVKSAKNDYLALLKKDLASSYSIGTSSSALSASVSADAKVIVGKQ